jgi:chromosome segregation and condensation protein ScpB
MADVQGLSDGALAVFAFAAYHQLSSGQPVSRVVQRDGAGHRADDAAVAELTERGFVQADGEEIKFTSSGEEALQAVIASIRGGRSAQPA